MFAVLLHTDDDEAEFKFLSTDKKIVFLLSP